MAGRDEEMRVVLATHNSGKIEEVRRILEPLGITLLGLDAFPDPGEALETGATFLENALLKARVAAAATGIPALADDSGITLEALDGGPGVRSARYGGEPPSDARNNERLMEAMRGVQDDKRGASYVCVAAAALPGGDAIWEEGRWRGRLLVAPRGEGGFGYDPLFLDPETNRTAAEMSAAEKDARSHRGRAFRKLAPRLREFLPRPRSKATDGLLC